MYLLTSSMASSETASSSVSSTATEAASSSVAAAATETSSASVAASTAEAASSSVASAASESASSSASVASSAAEASSASRAASGSGQELLDREQVVLVAVDLLLLGELLGVDAFGRHHGEHVLVKGAENFVYRADLLLGVCVRVEDCPVELGHLDGGCSEEHFFLCDVHELAQLDHNARRTHRGSAAEAASSSKASSAAEASASPASETSSAASRRSSVASSSEFFSHQLKIMNFLIKILFELGLLFVEFADVEVQPVFGGEVRQERVEAVFLQQVQVDGRESQIYVFAESLRYRRESMSIQATRGSAGGSSA